MTAPLTTDVTVSQLLPASPERAHEAWLDARLLADWMFGPKVRNEAIIKLELNPIVGGTFSFLVERDDMELDHVGQYLELSDERLVFSWDVGTISDNPSVVTVSFTAQDGGCLLTLTHHVDQGWGEFEGPARGAWAKMLASLARHLAERASPSEPLTAPK